MTNVPWWVFSRLFFALGSINLVLAVFVDIEFDPAICCFLAAVCAGLYAQEDESTGK